jgi:hypothetical protein
MPFLSRENVPLAIRRKHEDAYKNRLRQSLLDPSLSAEQRKQVKRELDGVGKPKEYRADTPPPPGAISFVSEPPPNVILAALDQKQLLALAHRLGVPTDGGREELITRLAFRAKGEQK